MTEQLEDVVGGRQGQRMLLVLQSCVAGTNPCNDTGSGFAGLQWLEWLGLVPVLALAVLVL